MQYIGKERTAQDCRAAERAAWIDYQKAEGRLIEPLLDQMLAIARNNLKRDRGSLVDRP